MRSPLLGIHHVTAIVEDPQENVDFYTKVLGLRLVKQTVNFDDPYTYHLYYGDEQGRPGTIVTFFPWPEGRRGSRGTGQISAFAFAVPPGALAFWQRQLAEIGWRFGGPEERAGGLTLSFYDPAGLLIELVEQPGAARGGASDLAGVPADAAITGISGVTLTLAAIEPTAQLLTERLGFRALGGDGGQGRFVIGDGPDTAVVTLLARPEVPRGQVAAGSVHHVAWRVPDEAALLAWRSALEADDPAVTPVRDRQYFRSIYFREPGGVIFELATDVPGFAVNEAPEALGAQLQLPPWLEPRRAAIEGRLPPLVFPGAPAASEAPAARPEAARPELGFQHVYEPAVAEGAPTLLLLHGTGGNEYDLLDLGRTLFPGAGLLSPRGQVLENGMPRFFRRLAEGVFDLDDLRRRTHDLAAFVGAAAAHYGFDPRRVIAVGYSNGANIAASLMLLRPEQLAGAVLLHAMVPLEPEAAPDLRGVPVFMGAGRADPLIPAPLTERLAELLREAGAAVTLHWEPGGHGLNQAELRAAAAWLRANTTTR
jgi:predicted esterase/catechol 2,3-dioxygenase-like lactoylglutathione lyase family enzyme